ncbi:MAG: ABC transporter ATP-binding protein [Saprospiraceae bacterium]|uniref:ABC transporter ATP-binding protein n=1 Tax=Candidatus Defluviibacterium haderslevense TaxID=2981993 RepID=A0A9D7SES3_9BACT|nr:ABC transporter ATP-binding protein [Candidatus Defluviibacterium haderslevense]MBK9719809.1 ABC transporter ATP-binding protein [Candidatus Defluviibacterium haderslevense]
MIYCDQIDKKYQNLQILKGVSLRIEKGSLVSIVGSSGAGKSTLLHILGTLDKPDKGRVILDGVDVFSLNESGLAKFRNEHIGFIFQFHHLLPELTALENAILPGLIAKKSESRVMEKGKSLLDFLGLGSRLDHKPSQLSGGEQQRVALARALINQPKILFADEPTGNLDHDNAQEILSMLLELKKEFQMTMLIVTHDPAIANRTELIYTMRDGMIV